MLLVNASDATVQVEAVGVIDVAVEADSPATGDFRLLASADSLPRDLEPAESILLEIEFETAGV